MSAGRIGQCGVPARVRRVSEVAEHDAPDLLRQLDAYDLTAGALLTVALAGCYVPPSGPTPTTTSTVPDGAPTSISGEGRYDYTVFIDGVPSVVNGNPATFSLVADGNVYAGDMVDEVAGPSETKHLELTRSGTDIVEFYSRDANVGAGVGFEIRTSDVTTSSVTGGVPNDEN